ncbi:hypothetical protein SCUP515_09442 [Seiridium cupressi]
MPAPICMRTNRDFSEENQKKVEAETMEMLWSSQRLQSLPRRLEAQVIVQRPASESNSIFCLAKPRAATTQHITIPHSQLNLKKFLVSGNFDTGPGCSVTEAYWNVRPRAFSSKLTGNPHHTPQCLSKTHLLVTTNRAHKVHFRKSIRFIRSPCLPTELRLKIWRERWVRRNVTIHRDYHGLDAESCERFTPQVFYGPYSYETTMHIHYAQQVLYPVNGDYEYYYLVKTTTWTSTPPPVTLFVNHEARTETLLHYELSFGLPGGETRVYFNFDLDALHLRKTGNLMKMLQLKDLRRI